MKKRGLWWESNPQSLAISASAILLDHRGPYDIITDLRPPSLSSFHTT